MLLNQIEKKIQSRFPSLNITLSEVEDSAGYTVYVHYDFGIFVPEMKELLQPLTELVWVVFEENN